MFDIFSAFIFAGISNQFVVRSSLPSDGYCYCSYVHRISSYTMRGVQSRKSGIYTLCRYHYICGCRYVILSFDL